jgi:uncharacterized membrane protein YqgA involved in biofilm formation
MIQRNSSLPEVRTFMTGTILNIVTVLIGSALGVALGGRLSDKMRETVLRGLGIVTLVIGLQMALTSANILIVLGSVLVGGILGEWGNIEEGLRKIGAVLEARFNRGGGEGSTNRFIRGFVTASLLFCVGPMTILGSIQDGLSGDYRLLAIKAMLDGFAALAFSSSLGIGVAFSTLVILIYQGGLSLLAAQAQGFLTEAMITEMTAAGGVLIVGLGISTLLEIKPIRVGNFLPALLIAPLVVWALTALGLPIAPQF